MRQVDAKYNQRHLKVMRLEVRGNSRKGGPRYLQKCFAKQRVEKYDWLCEFTQQT